jgi:hypothetical protein
MKKYLPLVLFISLVFILASCAPGNQKFIEEPAGFFMGLWHGFISLFTFVISLFNDNVRVYEMTNTGHLYDLGFIIGISMFYGGGSKSSCWKRR